jgi:hypothetical protein
MQKVEGIGGLTNIISRKVKKLNVPYIKRQKEKYASPIPVNEFKQMS